MSGRFDDRGRAGETGSAGRSGSLAEVLGAFLQLGLTSFGGPVAHLGYFRAEFVARRRWLTDEAYADLVALCQFLPGPASSQVGIAVGTSRAGFVGGLVAWLGFTLPSAVLMTLLALGLSVLGEAEAAPWVRGLKVVAVAVVAQAVWGMAVRLCPDRPRRAMAVAAAAGVLLWPAAGSQVVVILLAGLAGWWFLGGAPVAGTAAHMVRLPRWLGWTSTMLLLVLLTGGPLARQAFPELGALALFDSFARVGSLVFGGGHVVLPLLQAEVVDPGWVSESQFLAGYGAAQAVPGPLFTLAAFLGAASTVGPGGWLGATLGLGAVFLPSVLLVFAVLPVWDRLRRHRPVQAALAGINAAVVGLLLAALYHPVWTAAIQDRTDFVMALGAFALLEFYRAPSWLVVVLGGVAGAALHLLSS